MAVPQRGEVWRADLGEPRGHEQALVRPVVVLQSDLYQDTSTVVVVPLTGSFPIEAVAFGVLLEPGIAGLTKPSLVLCHQLRALDRRRLLEQLGILPVDSLGQIEALVMTILGFPL